MKLSEYLEALKRCPDEEVSDGSNLITRLTLECGISDNWPILLHADYATVVSDLRSSQHLSRTYRFVGEKTKLQQTEKGEVLRKKTAFELMNGAANIPIYVEDWVWMRELTEPHNTRQLQDYNMSAMLFSVADAPRVQRHRAIAEVAIDLGEYASKQRVPLCFPKSMPHSQEANEQEMDLSKIVYFDPSK